MAAMNSHDSELIERYFQGDADARRQLLARVREDPDLKSHLRHQIRVHRLLKHSVHAKTGENFVAGVVQEIQRRKPSKRSWRWQMSVLAASCCVIFAIFAVTLNWHQEPSAVGSISKLAGTEPHLMPGQSIDAGSFYLSTGYAELSLTNGVVLLLESPARLEFEGANRVLLTEGALVAKVPPEAIGFAVDTPSSNIVDLGTEFGVAVDGTGASQVHVLEGEVKVKTPNATEYENLYQNDARAFDIDRQVEVIESLPNRFMRTLPGRRYQDPHYLHWNFDDFNGRFGCEGPGINGQCFPAKPRTLSGSDGAPDVVSGAFDDAVYFDGTNQWLSTAFPGIGGSKPRTVAFWVKVPQDFEPHQGFGILSWGLADKLSAWQISINPLEVSGPLGRIRIGTNEAEIVGTTDLRDNRWHHVAIVLFGGDKADLSTHVLMYIDGKLERSFDKSIARVFTDLDHPKSKPLMMGRNIAFSDLSNTEKVNRFFRGAVDEVFIFDTALTQKDIVKLMRTNSISHKKR
ncbi:LamG-like jellyroll fold domain-containing protein [Marinimicrobium agarilyticum]|uniref:LamG-like jellyroll fold domain-containing protein n=1 Tax=Marinimicrobium agarilyticum TaxID=306546 RepID=UPI0004070773|nr:LamG-like jellyroll fold domain-containing protein [Marinimicrobium agarilyticum]